MRTRMPRVAIRTILAISMLCWMAVVARAQEGERKVTLDQVPAKVAQAIQKAVGEGKLVDIGEFSMNGKKVYEIEMVQDHKEYDVLFSSDGEVLKKTFEGVKGDARESSKEEEAEEDESGEENEEAEEGEAESEDDEAFQDSFDLASRELSDTGRNKFFILEPGYRLVLEGSEGGHTVRLEIIVVDETKTVDGTSTRVVEERESVDGALQEVSRNFYACDGLTKSIFYFGEEVDLYKDGKVVGHEGAWMAGTDGARAGMMMPGEVVLGGRFYQEVAPGQAMDRAEIAALDASLKTPAGVFDHCLRTREENPLDKEVEYKTYAPGIGLIQDEHLLLKEYGFQR